MAQTPRSTRKTTRKSTRKTARKTTRKTTRSAARATPPLAAGRATVAGAAPSVWAQNPEIAQRLAEVLSRAGTGSATIVADLQKLVAAYGDVVYAELLFLISHLHFAPETARHHWERIVELQHSMQQKLRGPLDVRVALVGYFVHVNKKLKNPKIIELKLFQETEASAYRDGLTGLFNYRYFREHLGQEVLRYERYSTPLSLAMVDIDDFKMYNDLNGHEAGNEAIRAVAKLLLSCVREVDVAVRYGGEEFALIMPATDKQGAIAVADRVCQRVAAHGFPHGDTQPVGLFSVSVGVATYPADAKDATELVRRADQAMYVAKSRGKNQAFLFGSDRRSYRRIEATLQGAFCVVQAEYLPFHTLNVSEGGLLLLADRRVTVGSLIDLQLVLPGVAAGIACTGRAVRVEETEEGGCKAAIRIVSISNSDRRRLTKYVREEANPTP